MSNLERLRTLQAKNNWPTLLISESHNVSWLTGFTGSFGYVLVSADKYVFITDSRYSIQAAEQVKGADIKWFGSPKTLAPFLAEVLAESAVTELAFESEYSTYATFEKWQTTLEGIKLVGISDIISPLRLVKTKEEVAKIRSACGLADATFDYLLPRIQKGVREYDLQLELEFFIRRNGAGLAFEPIVVSGERSARPHGKASEKTLNEGDFLTMDFGAILDGYNSDLTRTVVIGKASDRHKEIYNQVLKAQLAAIGVMKPGVSGKDVDGKSREVLDEKDLAKYFGHGLGHGLGIGVHDGGSLNRVSTNILEPGQVWTVEPGVYIEGFGGVRIEDDVVVTDTGVDILTHSPKELMEVG